MTNEQGTTRTAESARAAGFLKRYRSVDRVIFAVEAGIVTAATLLMTIFVFLDIVFQLANSSVIQLGLQAEAGQLWTVATFTSSQQFGVLGFLFLVGAMGTAAMGQNPSTKHWGVPLRVLSGVGIAGLMAAFAYVMVIAHPKIPCLIIAGAFGLVSAVKIRGAVAAKKWPATAWLVWLVSLVLLVPFAASVPDAYSSWTQPYALFLLLWTGFMGASMATSQGRHLRVDAVRKAIPDHKKASYNALSCGFAALFSGAFCYISIVYTLKRLGGEHTEGQIPDWLRVLAIPIAMAFITFRFGARAILGILGHVEEEAGEVPLNVPAVEKAEEGSS